MNYEEVLAYMYESLPMYHRVGAAALKPGLGNIISLCDAIGNPEKKIKTIHVAGTNGKGSSSHLLAAIFQKAGYKTGLYTSPHLQNFTERVKINGQEISHLSVTSFVNNYFSIFETIKPSFFEMTVALAFDYFANQKVDIAIIEVGLGGRLDSTNIIQPELSLITNISMDHQALLGDTLEKIASEKAGIIKYQTPVVISETQEQIKNVFIEKSNSLQAPILFAQDTFRIESMESESDTLAVNIYKNNQLYFEQIASQLVGQYQTRNLAGVIASVDILISKGWHIPQDAIVQGISDVVEITGLKGRWQKLSDSPKIIADIAHNEGGILEILKQLKHTKYQKLFWVFGMVSDKDVDKILQLLPLSCFYLFCQANIPRAMQVNELYKKAQNHSLKGIIANSVRDALDEAKKLATADDLILIGGSTFVVAEALEV